MLIFVCYAKDQYFTNQGVLLFCSAVANVKSRKLNVFCSRLNLYEFYKVTRLSVSFVLLCLSCTFINMVLLKPSILKCYFLILKLQ